MVESTEVLNHDLWREPNEHETRAQPGDKEDERDEQCTALKDVGGAEASLDSFHCTQHMRHYSICSNSPYTEVFSIDAFSGANLYFFFTSGQVIQHPQGTVYPNQMYRDPQIESMINNADRIRLKLFNLDKTDVEEYLVFAAPKNGGLEAWFDGDYVIESSWWDVATDTYEHVINIGPNDMYTFKVLNVVSGKCNTISGWFYTLSYHPTANLVTCPSFGRWWVRPELAGVPNHGKFQQPVFQYIHGSEPKKFEDVSNWSYGGRMTIEVFNF